MQGPVYGHCSEEASGDEALFPHFHYDDLFGTVVNRFAAQAACGLPLTVYGKGYQRRGYLDLDDALQCLGLVVDSPPPPGKLRIFNQFTEIFSVLELAERVHDIGARLDLDVAISQIANPRREHDEHYYRPAHDGLLKLGLAPRYLSDDRLAAMIAFVRRHRHAVDTSRIMPRVSWA